MQVIIKGKKIQIKKDDMLTLQNGSKVKVVLVFEDYIEALDSNNQKVTVNPFDIIEVLQAIQKAIPLIMVIVNFFKGLFSKK